MPERRRAAIPRLAFVVRVVAVVLWAVALVALTPHPVRAAGPIVPDSGCADEAKYKSLQGDTKALLQVINKSPQTVDVYWLDYTGKRVLYQQLPPFTEYNQETWLTHPWVITNTSGQCYRFLVMTSQLQSVTVEGEPPDPDTTVGPLPVATKPPPPTPSPAPPTVTPTAEPTIAVATSAALSGTASGTASPASSQVASQGPDSTAVLVIGAVAAVAVAGGALAVTGRLPGIRRGIGK